MSQQKIDSAYLINKGLFEIQFEYQKKHFREVCLDIGRFQP